ncbi:hypothetical protein [Nitrospira sp. Nam74]
MSTSVPRILLVDDDPVLLQGLRDMLTYRLRPVVVVVHASSDDVLPKVREGTVARRESLSKATTPGALHP